MEFEYKGVKFEQFHNGLCLFHELPSWVGHSSRYFTDEELDNMNEQAMRSAIDRMLAHAPIYVGDLRFRNRVSGRKP